MRIIFLRIFLRIFLPMTASQFFRRPLRFLRTAAPCIILLLTSGALVSCSKPANTASTAESETHKETGLESIPAPDPSKFPKLQNMSGWKNPYFVVRDDGIGLVDLSNHEVHILTPEQIPAELVSLGSAAWPYGRVVLVTQAVPKDANDQTKATIRKNRALLAGTLKELNVQMEEFP